jgi:hypothetical protein
LASVREPGSARTPLEPEERNVTPHLAFVTGGHNRHRAVPRQITGSDRVELINLDDHAASGRFAFQLVGQSLAGTGVAS